MIQQQVLREFSSLQEQLALKEVQEKERREKAEEKFKEWLTKANGKSRASPKSPCYTPSRDISMIWKLLTNVFMFVPDYF